VWVPSSPDNGFSSVNCGKAIAASLRLLLLADTVDATLAWWATLSDERRAKAHSGIAPEREAEVLADWEDAQG